MTADEKPGEVLQGQRILAALNGIELFGHERGNIEVFKALRQLGAEIYVGVNAIEDGGPVGNHVRRLGFETFALPFGNQWSWKWLKREPLSVFTKAKQLFFCSYVFWRAIRRFQPTHIHLGSPLAYAYLSLALAANRTPLVYRMGDAPPVTSPVNLAIWRQAMRRTNQLVCNSEFVRSRALVSGASDAQVIYNLSHLQNFVSATGDFLDEDSDATRLVYVGAVSEHKGLIELVESVALLLSEYPALKLDVVGGSRYDSDFRGKLKERLRALKIDGHVNFHGHVDDPSRFYRRANIHVAPSLWDEPSANVVVEAKNVGTPSVVFPSGGLPELINHQVDGYICKARTVDALTDGLRWMLKDVERLRRMGDAARADSRARFAPERFARSWASIYLNR